MLKKEKPDYLEPKIEITEFSEEDIITTSNLDNEIDDGWGSGSEWDSDDDWE